MKMRHFKWVIFILLVLTRIYTFAQIVIGDNEIDLSIPKEYEIGGVVFTGVDYMDVNALRIISGLSTGQKIVIPGKQLSDAIKNLWKQKLFAHIEVYLYRKDGNLVFLEFRLEERPRLSKFKITGVKKGEADDIREKIHLVRGRVLTDEVTIQVENTIKKHFIDKGYPQVKVDIRQEPDTTMKNHVMLFIHIKKGPRIKIKEIKIDGNEALSDRKIKRTMKKTKTNEWWTIFTISKFKPKLFEEDKEKIIAKYNEKGYRDARIVRDTVYMNPDKKTLTIEMTIYEGPRYYFRNIEFVGNTKYSDQELRTVLGIKKGDVYNQKQLETRLYMNPNGTDITSLYMDQGYLFFSLTPVEKKIENDSIDLEIRIYEGKQATVNKVYVRGNNKTNDHVIMREIRTKPGQLFSRSDIIRTQRELASLGYFDPEKLGVNPKPNPENGTVDIEYVVEEKPSDQIQLSGGFGGNQVVGNLGIVFTNFSTRNFFKKDAWRPLPSGDGQRLSVNAQSTGSWYQSYNISFTEPWLGGKNPNSLTLTAYHSVYTNGARKFLKDSLGQKYINPARQAMIVTGFVTGFGKRLKWPDDYFSLYLEANYAYYDLRNYTGAFIFSNGYTNNVNFTINLTRNSTDQPIYPKTGSMINLSFNFTPPYSYFRQDVNYGDLPLNKRFHMLEYHKWKIQGNWYVPLAGKLVLRTFAGWGFLGYYTKSIGIAPFERFYMGGSGLTNFQLDGREIIALRGYEDGALSPRTGASIATKYTAELRYPLSTNPNATIFVLSFAEAGNSWTRFKYFNPFQVYRSAGMGIRIFMPMFGLLGLDWGYRFDSVPGVHTSQSARGQLHFMIGTSLNGW